MSQPNPFRSPASTGPLARNWWAISARVVGGLLVVWQLAAFLFGGVASLTLVVIGVLLIASGSVRDLFFPPSPGAIRRQVQRDFAQRVGAQEPGPPPEEFLRKLEEEE